MSEYLSRNQQLAAMVQADATTPATPDPVTDAMRVRQSTKVSTSTQSVNTDEARGGLDQSPTLPGASSREVSIPFYLRGSGAAGTAPEFDPVLRAAGMSATILAADVVGQAQAGAVSSITLAAGASAVKDAYKGFVIIAKGQSRIVTSYDGTTKVATIAPAWDTPPAAADAYTIPAGVLYRTVSVGLEAVTVYRWQHRTDGTGSRLKKLYNGTADLSISVQTGQPFEATATVRGIFDETAPHEDTPAKPDAKVFPELPAPLLKGAQVYLGGKKIKLNSFSLQLGTDPQLVADPNSSCGYAGSAITNRKANGKIDAAATKISTRDALSDWLASRTAALWINAPQRGAGNRVSLYLPELTYTGNDEADINQFVGESIPFESTQVDGALYLLVY